MQFLYICHCDYICIERRRHQIHHLFQKNQKNLYFLMIQSNLQILQILQNQMIQLNLRNLHYLLYQNYLLTLCFLLNLQILHFLQNQMILNYPNYLKNL